MKITNLQNTFADLLTIGEERMRERILPRGKNQCRAAVRPPATIKARTIKVVIKEYFRSLLIKFSPFYSHTKSDVAHFCIHLAKNLPPFSVITVFSTSPFGQDRPKFHAYKYSVPAIDPFLSFRVVFSGVPQP